MWLQHFRFVSCISSCHLMLFLMHKFDTLKGVYFRSFLVLIWLEPKKIVKLLERFTRVLFKVRLYLMVFDVFGLIDDYKPHNNRMRYYFFFSNKSSHDKLRCVAFCFSALWSEVPKFGIYSSSNTTQHNLLI